MTATNPNLMELQRKAKEATKNATAAKKAAKAAKNAIGDYFKQRLRICVDKGILVYYNDEWAARDCRFYLSVDNNKIFVHYRSEYGWTYGVDPIDNYMSRLEDDIHNYKDLYEETGEDYYEESMDEKKNKYEILKSIVDVLYN